MATFTELDLAQLQPIALELGLGVVRAFAPLAAGTINSNFSVETEHGRFFLRINEGKSDVDVLYEAALVKALHERGVPTPLPLASLAGQPFVHLGSHQVSAFPWVAGQHFDSQTLELAHCRAMGMELARLHRAARELGPDMLREGIYTPVAIQERFDRFADLDDPELAEARELLGEELPLWCERWESASRDQVIHGDLFPDNVLFQGHHVRALLDFEQSAAGSPIYDLAVCVNSWCFAQGPEPSRMRALLAGYTSLEPMPAEELWNECRAAAARFLVTRITDIYLAGEDKPDKDFRRFVMRLRYWRSVGPEAIESALTV